MTRTAHVRGVQPSHDNISQQQTERVRSNIVNQIYYMTIDAGAGEGG